MTGQDESVKIVLFGDSITEMGSKRDTDQDIWTYGVGYPIIIASNLYRENPAKYRVLNRGISGNKSVDLYARIKPDVWNEKPDVLSILVGVNDFWHNIWGCGVELKRYEKVYSMIIEETLERLPDITIILCEPFFLHGIVPDENYEKFSAVFDYAETVKSLAEKYKLLFLPLQEKYNKAAECFGAEKYLYDGIHPTVAGATLIADAWLKLYRESCKK